MSMTPEEILRTYLASLLLDSHIDHVEIKREAGLGLVVGRDFDGTLIHVQRHITWFELEDQNNIQKVIGMQLESAMEELDHKTAEHLGGSLVMPWNFTDADAEQVH